MDDARRKELMEAIASEIRHLDSIATKFLNYDPELIWRDRNMFAAAIRQPIGLLTALRDELRDEARSAG